MKLNFNIKNKKIVLFSLISLFLIILGVTYASFYFYFFGSSNLLKTDTISINYLEGFDVINISNALPKSDAQGIRDNNTFDFEVKTNTQGEISITYGLFIEKLEVDAGYTSLTDKQVKVYLTDYNDNLLVGPKLVSGLGNYMLYQKTNNHSETSIEHKDKYKLRVWLDQSIDFSSWDENVKFQYKFKIGVKTSDLFPPKIVTAAEKVIETLGTSGLQKIVHPADNTLQLNNKSSVSGSNLFNTSDEKNNIINTIASEERIEYRYIGDDDTVKNNYVYFNCSDIKNQTSSTCEVYRILGVFPVEDENGNVEDRVKLIREKSIGGYYWNSLNSSNINNDTLNNWNESSLNTHLNTTYYNSISDDYQSLIGNSKYYLGGFTTEQVNSSAEELYKFERKIDESDGGNYFCNNNPTNWTGKIALMYASDFVYSKGELSGLLSWLYNYTDWILASSPQYSSYAYNLTPSISYDLVYKESWEVRPVFYLLSSTQFVDGDGSIKNPYKLFK